MPNIQGFRSKADLLVVKSAKVRSEKDVADGQAGGEIPSTMIMEQEL